MQVDDLSPIKDDMIAFIAGHGLGRMKAFVPETVPSVLFDDDDPDAWKDFVEQAKAAGAPFVTISDVVLEPEDVATLIGQVRDQNYPDHDAEDLEEAQELTRFVGKTGYIQLGFSSGGVVYLCELATDWYDRFQELMDSVSELGQIMIDDPEDQGPF